MPKKLSVRHSIHTAAIERPSGSNIGVSTAVRKYWRKYFQSVAGMQGDNDQINYLIATDYSGAQPMHRFILRSKEVAEVRKSQSFYYVAAIRSNGAHDVIVIQPSYKESDPEISKQRLTEEWLKRDRK